MGELLEQDMESNIEYLAGIVANQKGTPSIIGAYTVTAVGLHSSVPCSPPFEADPAETAHSAKLQPGSAAQHAGFQATERLASPNGRPLRI